MFKNISKVVLVSFLLTGAAKAALIYNDDSHRFTLDVKAEVYATHDTYGFKKRYNGRTTGPVEFIGSFTLENFYTKQFDDDFRAIANLKLKVPVFGYSMGAYGDSNAISMNQCLSTFNFVNRANIKLVHSHFGTITAGRYKSFYSEIVDYSDVDIFVGSPANDVRIASILGGSNETGVAYTKDFANSLVLGISVDAAKDTLNYVSPSLNFRTSSNVYRLSYILRKDYKVGALAQFDVNDDFRVGAAYNIAGFRVDQLSNQTSYNSGSSTTVREIGRNLGQNIITGISYSKRGTTIGVTGNFQNYHIKVDDNIKTSQQVFGVEAGLSYDISGVERGFRPSVQYDLQKGYSQYRVTEASSSTKVKQHTLDVHSVELGLSYYVNPSLYYVAAAVVDLRTDREIAKVDSISKDDVKKRHYLGVGVVYKF